MPSEASAIAVPFALSWVRGSFAVETGPNGMVTPAGTAAGFVWSTAPCSQIPCRVIVVSRTPGTYGEPIGRGIAICPFATTPGKPK